MFAARFLRKAILSLMIFLAVWALGITDKPGAIWLREYVAFAVSTDVNWHHWWPALASKSVNGTNGSGR